MAAVQQPGIPPTPAPRGRWKRRGLAVLLVLVLLVLLAPLYGGPLLRGMLVRQLEERLDARVRVQAVSFSWPATLGLHSLTLSDESGAPLASVEDVQVRLELGGLLVGKLRAQIEVEYPEVLLTRTPGGPWNWEGRLARALEGDAQDGDGEAALSDDEALPDVEASLQVRGGRIVMRAEDGDTTLEKIDVDVRLVGLERPASFALGVALRGPAGSAGSARLEGSFTAAPRGRIDWREFGGWASLVLESIDLAAFAPAVSTLVPLAGLGGIAAGRVELELVEGLALTGEGSLTIDELALQGPLLESAARIGRVQLSGSATQAEGGAGSQRLQLEVGEFLSMLLEGRSNAPPTGPGAAGGTLALTADLGPLTELAGHWFALQAGVSVRGKLEQSLDFTLALEDLRPTAASLRARAGMVGLAGNDGAGRALDLSELEHVALDLEASASFVDGTLSVPRLALDAGPLRCNARLEGRLDSQPYALKEAAFDAVADLERLRGTLSQIFELDDSDFGGRLEARGRVEVADGTELASGRIDASTLSFGGSTLEGMRAELEARRSPAGEVSGSATLQLTALDLSVGGRETVALGGMDATLSFREDADGKGVHTLEARTADGALSIALEAESSRAAGGELALTATARGAGNLALLAHSLEPFLPLRPGIAGRARLVAELQGSWSLDGAGPTSARGELEVSELGARDAQGRPMLLQALAPAKLTFDGTLDPRQDELRLRSFALGAPATNLRGAVVVGGLMGAGEGLRIRAGSLAARCDLQALGAELALGLDTGGWVLGGGTLEADLDLQAEERVLSASGSLTADRLLLESPGGNPLELEQVASEFELGLDLEQDRLDIRRAELHASTGDLSVSGTLQGLRTPEEARGTLRVVLSGALERLLADLGLEDPAGRRRSTGALAAEMSLEGDRGTFQLNGRGTLERFRLEIAPEAEGGAPIELAEPTIELEWEALVRLAGLDLDLARLTIDSGIVRGGARGRIENLAGSGSEGVRFSGLTGDLVYVPDRLGALLAPFLPGRLSGKDEQRLTFTLDGHARSLDLASLLSTSTGRLDLGIGLFERPEIALGGVLALEAKQGKLLLRGDLDANGGKLQIDGLLALASGDEAPTRSRLTLTTKDLRATPGLAPLLGILHPAFAQAELTGGSLEGLIDLTLDLSYDGALTLEQLQSGWDALPKKPINGSGRLELRQTRLRDSPLLGMMEELGLDASKGLDVRPIEFTLRAGRVTYAKPWTWSMSGTETTFTGSVGLDESLDLSWNLPIAKSLVSRWSFLSALEGQTLSIPLRGSVRAPRLEVRGLLDGLAAKAMQAELEGRLGLGGGDGNSPASLLTRADELWKQGQRVEAAGLYKELRERFKLSLTYVLNKDRIKKRSKYRPSPR